MMASIRNELNLLDAKISEFHQLVETSENELEPIALEPVDFLDIVETVAEEPVEEPAEVHVEEIVEETVEETATEVESIEVEPEVAVEAEPEPELEPELEDETESILVQETIQEFVQEEVSAAEPEVDDLPADDLPAGDNDDLPFFDEPVTVTSSPIIDTLTDKQAWRSDMPGGKVNDVRSAISLHDRLLFINKLFDEDPIAFQTALGKINTMESLDEVIGYVASEHSDWNLESDTVYRFMMAIRRKVR